MLQKGNIGDHTTAIRKEDSYEEEYNKNVKVSTIGVLQQFVFFMINYDMNSKSMGETLLKYGKEYKLDSNELFEILKELQIPQKVPIVILKDGERIVKRYEKLLKFFNKNITFSVLALSVPYMENKELRQLLILNKEGYMAIKHYVFRHLLLNQDLNIEYHFQIWANFLNIVF